MNSRNILYPKGKNDERYTPKYGVIPILKYIPTGKIIWCPFDKEDSEFVKQISKTHKVVFSHIEDNKDFYFYEPHEWDIIISNPPFTNKRLIFERALSFNKPFALLMSNTWLNDSAPSQLFKIKDLQLLMFDKRINYINSNSTKQITFSSSYFCWNFLPKQIICENIITDVKEE